MVFLYLFMGALMISVMSGMSSGIMFVSLWQMSELSMISDFYSYSFSSLLIVVSGCVLIWSYYYMSNESNYRRFLSLVCLFILSMMTLIFIPSMMFSIIGWDGLGVTSFLLVIYYSNRKSLSSGMLTGLTNRIGDAFFLIAIPFLLFGTSNMWMNFLFLTLCLTKKAQYPFSSWLPAAMAAPNTVSALVHSSTLVTAGLYLLVRYNFCSNSVLLVLGSLTMMMAGICACAETDLKKIVALSTLSQLGVMAIALGVQSKKIFAFFHLLSHALFKALLFMCVGVLIHSVFGSQESRSYNLLEDNIMGSSSFMIVASTALCGFPFFSGFYSKDSIVENFYMGSPYIFYLLFLSGIGFTTVYSVKMIFVALGSNKLTEVPILSNSKPRWFVKCPLMILGLLSVTGGYMMSNKIFFGGVKVVSLDFIQPLVFIISGVFLGIMMSNYHHPNQSNSMLFLTPNFQFSSKFMMKSESSLKLVDSGFMEWGGPSGFSFSSGAMDQFWLIVTSFLFGPLLGMLLLSL
uniref:NADH:ubiquinone reductase (H(+)-translocating) n=1 Tax=Spadella cephaloptera TaxID=52888 RepID=A0A141CKG7_9BILA|nr:NADH dehydrogenase subunit 5 [Spadella cephaloptera]